MRDDLEVGWLIEFFGDVKRSALYYGEDIEGDADAWQTYDNSKAIRFSRKVDAERCARLHGWTDWSVVEHGWHIK